MFLDIEGGTVNIKIVLASEAPGAAASFVRRLRARTPPAQNGELREPEAGKIRLLGFDWFVEERALPSGEIAHPHVYAIEASDEAPITPGEWSALLHGADAVVRVGEVDAETDASIAAAVSAAMDEAAARPGAEPGEEPYGFVNVQCPWCFEDVELTVEADVEGSFVQDCEVCCRPWSVEVSRDQEGELQVEVLRA